MRDLAARAWVGGQPISLTELPARTLSALRGRSTCAVAVRDLPASVAGQPAQVDLLVNGRSTRFFTGLTAERGAIAATMQRTTNLVDLLDLDKAPSSAITWSSRSFPDAVRDLLTAAGIAAADIDSIFDPGSLYALGDVYPIVIRTTENIGQIFRALMEFGGTSAYVTPSGRVRVVDSPGIPAATSATIYADGADLDAGELGIFDAGVQLEGNESVISVYTATGPKTPSGAVPDGTFTASGLVGKPDGKSYRFAQADAVCAAIAERELGRKARARVNLWITAPLNAALLPGDTILVRLPRLGYVANTPAYVMEAATAADAGMRLIVSLGPSKVSGYASSIAPPAPDFSMRVEHQLVTLAGVPVASYLVQCQDQSRDTSGATITGLSWAASGPGASPTSSSDPAPIFLFTSLEGAEIALTATSSTGESATVPRTPQASDLQVLSRVVSVAAGSSGWRVLAAIAGWRSFLAPGGASCTAVPAINEVGPLLSGWSSGAIYATADALASLPPLLATLDGSIGALWVNEADRLDILAGHGSSLSRSRDGGATWAPIGTFDDQVVDCQSSPGNPGEIRVCAGDALHLSYDGGAHWAVAAQGIAGSTAEALATAPWGHGAVFSGVGSDLASSVTFEEGHSTDWSGVDVAERPADGLTSITPLLEEEAFVVGETGDLVRDGALPALVLSAGSGRLYKLLWSGEGFTAALLPPASGSGAGKLITLGGHYPIDSESAQSIGYGPLAAPTPAPGILVLPSAGVSGTNDGVWVHDESGWHQLTPPIAGATTTRMASNPANRSEWIWATNGSGDAGAPLLTPGGQSAVWHTADAGATWTPVTLTCPDVGCSGVTGVHWLAVGGWAVVGAWGAFALPVVWRPSGGSRFRNNADGTYGDEHPQGFIGSTAGQGGEVCLAARQTNWYLYTFPGIIVTAGGDGWVTRITVGGGATVGSISVAPGTRTIYGIQTAGIWGGVIQRASDYRSGPFVSLGVSAKNNDDGRRCNLLAGADGVWFLDDAGAHHADTDGVVARTCGLSYPDTARLIGNADGTLVAVQVAHGLGGGVRLFNGTTWAEIAYPTGLSGANFGEGCIA